MTFSDWLDAEPGRLALVAQHFEITMSAVTQWRTSGVPVGRMLEVRALSDGKVTLEVMVAQSSAAKVAA
jgi:hypothetical protein